MEHFGDQPEEAGGLTVRELAMADGSSILRVAGELDIATAKVLEADLHARLGECDVLLDLGDVTFIDASGLSAILRAFERSRRTGHSLELQAPLALQPQRLVDLTGLGPLLRFRNGSSP